MGRWFRWYEDAYRDGKMRIAAEHADVCVGEILGLWSALLSDASNPTHRGQARRGVAHYAMWLGWAEPVIEAMLQGMAIAGLVERDGGNCVVITNWEKRQFETDWRDPTQLVRKQRFLERNGTARNAAERGGTVAERFETPDTETDTDTEAEKKTSKRPPKKKTKTPFPEGWLPTFLEFEQRAEFERFRNSAIAHGRTYANWDAAWRNWLSSPFQQKSPQGANNGRARQSTSERAFELADEWRRREREAGIRGPADDAGGDRGGG